MASFSSLSAPSSSSTPSFTLPTQTSPGTGSVSFPSSYYGSEVEGFGTIKDSESLCMFLLEKAQGGNGVTFDVPTLEVPAGVTLRAKQATAAPHRLSSSELDTE
ncbi:hypothetical protein C2845_PM05G37050 [Panicum miliaceum]|uniref:Uncharacterized protein n=1 Tax=Panicum miliaceum TaxID=4540 RepID=A0A3L6SXQ0_PANMI|nr:hypothetical protein C2845_PM05G37050 [Panicum miliaceum]